jgi:hypothetical protein
MIEDMLKLTVDQVFPKKLIQKQRQKKEVPAKHDITSKLEMIGEEKEN